jgi:hypothetical protein
MKKILPIICLLFASNNFYAQIKLALTGGVNLNTISWKDKDNLNVQSDSSDYTYSSKGQKQGFSVGILLNIKTEENWAFETGLVYTQRGGTTKETVKLTPSNVNFSRTQTFAPSYLQVPLYLLYKPENKKKYKIMAGAGGYFGFGVGGSYNSVTNIGTVITNTKVDRKTKFGIGLADDFAKMEIGLGAKVAFLMSDNLAFGASIQRSVINNAPKIKDQNGSALYNTIGFTITKYFGR